MNMLKDIISFGEVQSYRDIAQKFKAHFLKLIKRNKVANSDKNKAEESKADKNKDKEESKDANDAKVSGDKKNVNPNYKP